MNERQINVWNYQFKTQCNGDRHSSKTANIILQGLMAKTGDRPYVNKQTHTQIRLDELFLRHSWTFHYVYRLIPWL